LHIIILRRWEKGRDPNPYNTKHTQNTKSPNTLKLQPGSQHTPKTYKKTNMAQDTDSPMPSFLTTTIRKLLSRSGCSQEGNSSSPYQRPTLSFFTRND
jgi:hypothetical protein